MEEDFFRSSLFNEYFESAFEKEDAQDSISWMPSNIEECEGPKTQLSVDSQPEKKRKEKKKLRNIRVDDFDYSKYIHLEIQKQDLSNLPETARKHMIQKIRNRMSAQRSRIRSKIYQEQLEQEKEILSGRNFELQRQVELLNRENRDLRLKVEKLENSVATTVISDEEHTFSETSQIFRKKKIDSFNVGRTSFFMLMALVCVIFIPFDSSSNGSVRVGGVIPLLSSQLPKHSTHLKAVEDICKGYCRERYYENRGPGNDSGYQGNSNESFLSEKVKNEKQIQLFENKNDRLVCFDLDNEVEVQKAYKLIVKSSKITSETLDSPVEKSSTTGVLTALIN